MANPRESRAEIQRILEDFTRGTIDFQSLLNELDATFQVDASARTVALELVEQLHPNGALQRGFFRVLKDRIEQNLATGAPIPIVSHPRSAHAVDAVLQKDLPLDDRTVPFGRAGPETEEERGAGSADQPIQGDEAALVADTTVPLRAPTEPIATSTEPVSVTPEPTAPPLESAAPSTPSPGTVEPTPPPPPVPPPAAEADLTDAEPPRGAERAKPGTREPVVGPAPARERPFVTERRDIAPPKQNALNWIGGIIVIGLMATLVLLGPLRDYLPQIKAYAFNVQQEIAALFATQEPPAPTPEPPRAASETAAPPSQPQAPPSANEAAPSASATTPTTEPATTESTPSPQSMESAAAATAPTETPGAAARAGDATGEQQAAPSVASSSAQPQAPTAAPVPTPPSTTTMQPETPTSNRSATSDTATAAPAAKPVVAAAPPAPGRFTFASRSYRVREDAGMIALRIERRDGSAGAASVSWWTIPDTASAEEDYADFGARVEAFADGETTRTIYVPITSDDIAEDEETFDVQLGEPSAGASLGATATATVTILDDDL